jgi:hypothetical protein
MSSGKMVSWLAYSSALKMEAMFLSETSVDFQRTTRSYITEYSTLHNHRCENLKSYVKRSVQMCKILRRFPSSCSAESDIVRVRYNDRNLLHFIAMRQSCSLPPAVNECVQLETQRTALRYYKIQCASNIRPVNRYLFVGYKL